MVGFWATVALNIPDFTRYAKSQKAQILGQALGLPAAMTLYSFIGVAVTSASVVLFGQAIWDPVVLMGKFHQPVVASSHWWRCWWPRSTPTWPPTWSRPPTIFRTSIRAWISFRTGGLITGVMGVAMMPWRLLTDFSSYIFGWLVGYSGLLGPIAGVMIADYFLIRRARLNVNDLYRRGGEYEYRDGINPRAVVALAAGIAVALLGLVVPAVRWLYDYAWFVGFGVSGAVYFDADAAVADPQRLFGREES
jgi:NCS1 family nucleobase:cation symporter-1